MKVTQRSQSRKRDRIRGVILGRDWESREKGREIELRWASRWYMRRSVYKNSRCARLASTIKILVLRIVLYISECRNLEYEEDMLESEEEEKMKNRPAIK